MSTIRKRAMMGITLVVTTRRMIMSPVDCAVRIIMSDDLDDDKDDEFWLL
jgi:hypothetical protein